MYMSVLPTRVCLVPSEIERSDLQLEFETVVNLHGSTGNTHTHTRHLQTHLSMYLISSPSHSSLSNFVTTWELFLFGLFVFLSWYKVLVFSLVGLELAGLELTKICWD